MMHLDPPRFDEQSEPSFTTCTAERSAHIQEIVTASMLRLCNNEGFVALSEEESPSTFGFTSSGTLIKQGVELHFVVLWGSVTVEASLPAMFFETYDSKIDHNINKELGDEIEPFHCYFADVRPLICQPKLCNKLSEDQVSSEAIIKIALFMYDKGQEVLERNHKKLSSSLPGNQS